MNDPERVPLRVIKLGGSLLTWTYWPDRLRAWLDQRPAARNVLVVGGGLAADEIERRQRVERFSDRDAHWQCIEQLASNARIAAGMLAGSVGTRMASQREELDAAPRSTVVIWDPLPFLRDHERALPPEPLPEDWSVSSDSIAARIAEWLRADEFVLLKSRLAKGIAVVDDELVDRYFHRMLCRLPPTWICNLRCERLTTHELDHAPRSLR